MYLNKIYSLYHIFIFNEISYADIFGVSEKKRLSLGQNTQFVTCSKR